MIGIEKQAVGDLPVSPSSARLLVVTLHRFRERRVDHKSYVGLVNPHSERYCRADYLMEEQKPIRLRRD